MQKNKIMKTVVLLVAVAVLLTSFQQPAKKKIIFFGDSITEQGVKPGGYIKELDTLFQQKGLDKNYELAGAGISGNKVYDLYLRLESDVLAQNPDAVVIWIGVNDVWHKLRTGTGTDADKFEKFYRAIIKKLKDKNISVYLCTPGAIGEKNDYTNQLDGDLNGYSAMIRRIAESTGCGIIDLRKAFIDHLKLNNPDNKDRGILTTDGVHLNAAGNDFVARHMLTALSLNYLK
jgi:lysophospholipase L1-like esterase